MLFINFEKDWRYIAKECFVSFKNMLLVIRAKTPSPEAKEKKNIKKSANNGNTRTYVQSYYVTILSKV